MIRLLLDANAYTEFKRGRPEAIEILSHASLVGLDSVAIGELFAGFAGGSREERNRREFEEFCSASRVQRFPVDDRTADHYGRIFNALRRKGRPIPTNDIWIAASALRHNLVLFTFDSHFRYIPGLIAGMRIEHLLV